MKGVWFLIASINSKVNHLKCVRVPHILRWQSFVALLSHGVLLLHRIVGQVDRLVVVEQIVVLRTEAQVTLTVHPNAQRLDAGDEKPLADVEFRLVDGEGAFYWVNEIILSFKP